MNGSLDLKIILSGTSSAVNGIALDWAAGNIYWTDGLYKWIAVARAVEKSKGHKTLLSTGLDRPQGIAVWPQKGFVSIILFYSILQMYLFSLSIFNLQTPHPELL